MLVLREQVVLGTTVAELGVEGDPSTHPVGEPTVQHAAEPVAFVLVEAELEAGIEVLGRRLGVIVERTAGRVAAEQGALRPLEYLDSRDVVLAARDHPGFAEVHLVDVLRHG